MLCYVQLHVPGQEVRLSPLTLVNVHVLPSDIFEKIKFLPDTKAGDEGHYKSLSELYGFYTSKNDCPLSATPPK